MASKTEATNFPGAFSPKLKLAEKLLPFEELRHEEPLQWPANPHFDSQSTPPAEELQTL